jgi:hypothetical protein
MLLNKGFSYLSLLILDWRIRIKRNFSQGQFHQLRQTHQKENIGVNHEPVQTGEYRGTYILHEGQVYRGIFVG